jgi:hypothetical protein
VLPRNPFVRGDDAKSASLQEAPSFEFELSSDNYNCETHRRGADVDVYKLDNADPVARRMMEQGATRISVDNLLLQHEIAWSARFFVAGVWGKTVTGVAAAPGADQFLQWNDVNSDPEKDIDDAKLHVKLNGGLWPNALLVGPYTWNALKRHPKFVNRITPTSRENITPGIVAALLGLDRVVVAGASKATNAVGQAETYGFVHGKKALLAHVGQSGMGDLMPSAGRIRFESAMAYDNKLTGAQLGYFFETAVA